jgi:hypothetical protein
MLHISRWTAMIIIGISIPGAFFAVINSVPPASLRSLVGASS